MNTKRKIQKLLHILHLFREKDRQQGWGRGKHLCLKTEQLIKVALKG